ncbi:hypothetical protein ACIP98_02860 [Streptomyces sp. NPDC088354]|nr:hypothetical protein [Streptomyces sp. MI02-7b]MDX3076070.1 hypothetical protein [Streptomyces sp. MI02-7b]
MSEATPETGTVDEEQQVPVTEDETTEEPTTKDDGTVKPDNWHSS